jgi:hypothetical protein
MAAGCEDLGRSAVSAVGPPTARSDCFADRNRRASRDLAGKGAHDRACSGRCDLAQLARRYPDLSPEEQTVVRHPVGSWIKEG